MYRSFKVRGTKDNIRTFVDRIGKLISDDSIEILYAKKKEEGYIYTGLLKLKKPQVIFDLKGITPEEFKEVNQGIYTFYTKRTIEDNAKQLKEYLDKTIIKPQELEIQSSIWSVTKEGQIVNSTSELRGVIQGDLESVIYTRDALINNHLNIGVISKGLVSTYIHKSLNH